jgi:hypothetical protein
LQWGGVDHLVGQRHVLGVDGTRNRVPLGWVTGTEPFVRKQRGPMRSVPTRSPCCASSPRTSCSGSRSGTTTSIDGSRRRTSPLAPIQRVISTTNMNEKIMKLPVDWVLPQKAADLFDAVRLEQNLKRIALFAKNTF